VISAYKNRCQNHTNSGVFFGYLPLNVGMRFRQPCNLSDLLENNKRTCAAQ